MFSPYELNPLGLNPLRDLLVEQVDFDAVNALPDLQGLCHRDQRAHRAAAGLRARARSRSSGARLGLPAADVPGGRDRRRGLLGRRLHRQPRALSAAEQRRSPDILIVQINPIVRPELPRTARDIMNRMNEISFNSSLMKELRAIALMQRRGQ